LSNPDRAPSPRRKEQPARRVGRPWILLAGLAALSLAGWLRMEQAWVKWDLLVEFGALPGPLYQALSGAAWGIGGAAAIVLTWLRRRWSLDAALGLILFFAVSYWLDRLLLSQSPESQANTAFMGILSVVCLVYAWSVLWLQKENSR